MTLRQFAGLGALLSLVLPGLALAADPVPAPVLNSGDTSWMLTSTALVLFMTIPGLALFYGGMVRSKNILSVMMQCFAITGLISILWVIYGYSIAFDTTGMEANVVNFNSFFGSLSKAFLAGITPASITGPTSLFPEAVFVTFQMTFAIITPALIVGAFAERMEFSAMLVFMGIWFTLVYAPIAHMVWSGPGSLLGDWGVLDFAGGTVVHINAGSAAAANGTAGMAMLVTQIATAAAALGWMFAEWITHGKPSALGIASGVVAGLVAITPAAGTVGPMGSLIIGLAAGVVCFFCATTLKRKLGYDDSLDAFGVHGIGGILGAILTGVFAAPALGGFGTVTDVAAQVWIQCKGVGFTVIYTAIVTFIILKVLDAVMGLRVTDEEEAVGLDLAQHNERGYNL